MDDHYQTLGVSKTATQDEIKSAYRKLASKHHPDKEGGDTAKFQKIQAAYEHLGDADKRAAYDNPSPFGTRTDRGWQEAGVPHGFEDILRHFGGGAFGDMFGNRRQQPQRNSTLNLQTTITLEDAFFGKDLVANIQLPSGQEQIINVKIPPGVIDHTTLRLKELGDDTFKNQPRGDVHLTVTVMPHTMFERHGDDLIRTLNVPALAAILGTEIEVQTLDNKTLNVTIQPGTQPGATLGAQGYGMPNMHDSRFRGRLLLRINIIIPTDLTDQQKDLIRQASK